jgi:hypothetical protein
MVPDKLCSTPTLMVSAANACGAMANDPTDSAAAAARALRFPRRFIMGFTPKKVFNKRKASQLARESFCKAHANSWFPQKKKHMAIRSPHHAPCAHQDWSYE